MNALGLDIGGTKIALAKYEIKGPLTSDLRPPTVTTETIPTNSSGDQEAFLTELTELIERHLDDSTQAIGIGVPGPTQNGYVSKLPNIPNVSNLCLAEEIQKRLPTSDLRPPTISNDANSFIVGAWQLSQHKDKQNILGITLGTGVGGGLIINGKLIEGKDGVAGEFGHMILKEGKTFQDLCSGKALASRWQEQFQEEKSGQGIVEAAEQGDKDSLNFLKEVGKDLALAIGNLVTAFNPDAVLVGGSASAIMPFVQEEITSQLRKIRYPEAGKLPIEQISNGDFATFGAAWLAIKGA